MHVRCIKIRGKRFFQLDWHEKGIRRRVSAETDDAALAEQRRVDLEGQLASGAIRLVHPQVEAAPTPPRPPAALAQPLVELGCTGPTVGQFFEESWLPMRKQGDGSGWMNDLSHFKNHFLTVFGDVPIRAFSGDEGKAAVLRWLYALGETPSQRDGTKLASRTVRNITSSIRSMFGDALELRAIQQDPCLGLRWKKHLPKKRDKNPRWRKDLRSWTLEAVVALTTDPRLPCDRRVHYAVRFLTGLRPSSEAALRFSDLDMTREPHGLLSATTSYDSRARKEKDHTKTYAEYLVPLHPVLRRILDWWKAEGWEAFIGRAPRQDDLLVPTQQNAPRNVNTKRSQFYADLDTLGLQRQRPYETRATFRNLCLEGGAVEADVKLITHPTPSNASELYNRSNVGWVRMVRAVLSIDEGAWAETEFGPTAKEASVSPIGRVSIPEIGTGDRYGTYQTKTPATRTKLRGAMMVTPTGIEPMSSP